MNRSAAPSGGQSCTRSMALISTDSVFINGIVVDMHSMDIVVARKHENDGVRGEHVRAGLYRAKVLMRGGRTRDASKWHQLGATAF